MTRPGTTALLLLVALAANAAPAQKPSTPGGNSVTTLSIEAYISSLDSLRQQLETAGPEALPAVRQALPEMWRVQYRGQTVYVTLAWLGDLQKEIALHPKKRDSLITQATRRLRQMREEAQRWVEFPSGGGDQTRGRLDTILARPEFSGVRGPNWFERLRARIIAWVVERLAGLLGRFGDFSLVGAAFVWAVIALVLILVTIGGMRALRRPSGEPALNLRDAAPQKSSVGQWTQQALASAARGDYRLAVHHLYWAFIYRMDDLGAWQLDRARTHREYLRLISEEDQYRPPLAAITRRFESVWYGRQPATLEDFHEAAASFERLGCMLGSIPVTESS